MKKLVLVFLAGVLGFSANAQFVVYQQGFDNVDSLLTVGWSKNNKSNPPGTGGWRQADGSLSVNAYNGDPNACVTNDFSSVNDLGTISDWLISPVIWLTDGDTIAFYTVSYNSHSFPDRLELRLNATASTDVGANETTVGDFTTVLTTVNPLLDTTSYPSVQVQGDSWTRFAGVVTGLGGPVQCRFAFRYFMPDAGQTGTNGSTIGIDALSVISSMGVGLENDLDATVSVYPNPVSDIFSIRLAKPVNGLLRFCDIDGKVLLSQPLLSENTTVDVSNLAAGNYILQLTDVNSQKRVSRIVVVQ